MLSWDEIQNYLIGAWQLMFGKGDGLRRLDLSVDGFWNSFFAMLVALPPLLLMWIALANERIANGSFSGARSSLILIYALIDLTAWVLPLAVLAFVARPAGMADRFVAYVVSTNWASAIIAWIMLPIAILTLLVPGAELNDLLLFIIFIANSVMMWRLTNAALGKGPGLASAIFAAMLVGSILIVMVLNSMFGLGQPQS